MTELCREQVLPGVWLEQFATGFRYGTDAVLLANFVKPPRATSLGVEFGTGTGIVPLLLAQRRRFGHITAFEIQEPYARLAQRNMDNNGLGDRVRVIHADLTRAREYLSREVDFVFTNPPYMKMTSGELNPQEEKLVARHEKYVTVESLCESAGRILKHGGSFFIVYRAERLADLFCAMRRAQIEPKELVEIAHRPLQSPKLILCRGKKGAESGLIWRRQTVESTSFLEE